MSYDVEKLLKNIEKATELWSKAVEKISSSQSVHKESCEPLFLQAMQAFASFQNNMLNKKPEAVAQTALDWWQQSIALGQQQWQQFLNTEKSSKTNAESDRRFRSELWTSNAFYDSLKEQYKLLSQVIDTTLASADDSLDERSAQLVKFYGRQWRDALSPSNYLWSNPEVLKQALETQGESLVSGLQNLLNDLEQGRITMTPPDAFTLGKDIACTPGKVVWQNRLFQLIQYEAATTKVNKIPLLIIPAWINKYYILDLRPENSLVKWLTEQGFTVFIVSWINPGKAHQDVSFDDYLRYGAWAAAQQVMKATGSSQLHIAGYCLGGTLTACLLAWLKAKGKDNCVASATFLTTLTDFDKAGDLKVFIDDSQLAVMEKTLEQRGYLEGNEMAAIFNALRPQDLVWSFVVNNYLMGRQPMSFDLLYWNNDVTRMPAKMHLFYLREMYQHNRLIKGELTLGGEKIDLSRITTPAYLLSTQEDHIAPWQATYAATQLYKGPVRFVLSGSGHIAGVVNPPAKQKYGWRSNAKLPKEPNDWLKDSVATEGSWWPDWAQWLRSISNLQIPARKISKPIEDAPGSYAQMRA